MDGTRLSAQHPFRDLSGKETKPVARIFAAVFASLSDSDLPASSCSTLLLRGVSERVAVTEPAAEISPAMPIRLVSGPLNPIRLLKAWNQL